MESERDDHDIVELDLSLAVAIAVRFPALSLVLLVHIVVCVPGRIVTAVVRMWLGRRGQLACRNLVEREFEARETRPLAVSGRRVRVGSRDRQERFRYRRYSSDRSTVRTHDSPDRQRRDARGAWRDCSRLIRRRRIRGGCRVRVSPWPRGRLPGQQSLVHNERDVSAVREKSRILVSEVRQPLRPTSVASPDPAAKSSTLIFVGFSFPTYVSISCARHFLRPGKCGFRSCHTDSAQCRS